MVGPTELLIEEVKEAEKRSVMKKSHRELQKEEVLLILLEVV